MRENNVIVGWGGYPLLKILEASPPMQLTRLFPAATAAARRRCTRGGRNTEGWIEKNAISFFELWGNVLALRLLLDGA